MQPGLRVEIDADEAAEFPAGRIPLERDASVAVDEHELWKGRIARDADLRDASLRNRPRRRGNGQDGGEKSAGAGHGVISRLVTAGRASLVRAPPGSPSRHAASWSAGCLYCRAHTGTSALRHGVSPQKLADLPNYRSSPLFSEAERAAIDFAHAAGTQPNAVDDALFAELRRHWSEAAVVEILGVVGLFGFFNRWNDSMATTLEPEPLEQARQHLAAAGWTPGKHEPAPPISE